MGTDRATLQRTIIEVASWMRRAAALLGRRTRIMMDSTEANRRLSSAVLDLGPRDPQHQPTECWRALPLGPDDGAHLAALARLRALPPIAAHEEEALASLAGGREQDITRAEKLVGLRRLITFGQARHQAEQSATQNDVPPWSYTVDFRYSVAMDLGYARVSTTKQDLDRQIDALRQEGIAAKRIDR